MFDVLIVDDNVDLTESTALLVETIGYTAKTCYNGQEALRHLEEFLPRMILMDLDMPILDGYETVRAIRQLSIAQPFIVAISAVSGYDVNVRTRSAGFDTYIAKPANVNALISLVDTVMKRVQD